MKNKELIERIKLDESDENILKLFNEIIDCEDFTYKKTHYGYVLDDKQGANLGDIESNTFENLGAMLERMECYHKDYFEESLMEGYNITEHNGYDDLIEQVLNKNFDYDDLFSLQALYLMAHWIDYNILTEQVECSGLKDMVNELRDEFCLGENDKPLVQNIGEIFDEVVDLKERVLATESKDFYEEDIITLGWVETLLTYLQHLAKEIDDERF